MTKEILIKPPACGKRRPALKCRFFAIFLIILSCSSAVHSQDSLMFYLESAAKNNPAVLQKLAEYQAALERVPQAGALQDPEFTAGVFLQPMELVMGNQVADIQLMQMFPWFGTLNAAKDEMSLMAKAQYELFRETKQQVLYNVQRTWFELMMTRENIRISEKSIDILRALERIALVRFKNMPLGNGINSISPGNMTGSNPAGNSAGTSPSSGMQGMGGNQGNSPPATTDPPEMQNNSMEGNAGSGLSDLYRLQIEISDLDNSVARLKDQQNTLIAKFNSYLHRSTESPVSLPDTLLADSLGLPPNLIRDSMINGNPMLVMLHYEEQSLEARRKMVTLMSYPMIGIGLNYSIINKNEMILSPMNGKDMIMPMVSVTIPVYRKKYKAMQSEADLLKNASGQNYEAALNDLQIEYYEALQFFEDAKRRVVLYENQSLLAKKSLDILTGSFAVSGSDLADILQTRRQVYDYEYMKIEAVSDLNSAVAWLKRLAGY